MGKRPIELLAPAKDLASGTDALNCGADALYAGGPEFGARRGAALSLEDFGALCARAHRYGARVYAAVNTIFTDEELPRAAALIRALWERGADAAIIQDFGLLETDLPPIPLTASTQAYAATPGKAAFLAAAGFSRLVLPRELSLAEIKAIQDAAPDAELEFFAHGALCASYSGRCSLSFAVCGRSGNRGECAQPCRRLYRLEGPGIAPGPARHYLSLKDLDLSRRLGDLLDAGVTSFKIEGRLKDRAYVRNITAYYRRELDKLIAARGLARASYGASSVHFTPDPARTFNRGRTEYYLDGDCGDASSPAADAPRVAGGSDKDFTDLVMSRDPARAVDPAAPPYARREVPHGPTDHTYVFDEVNFSENILNSAAEAFYRRHGVKKIERAAEAGLDLRGRKVMTLRHCLRKALGLCDKGRAAPLFLTDDEGRRLRLEFDCARCRMFVFLERDKAG